MRGRATKVLVLAFVMAGFVALGVLAYLKDWPTGGDTAVYRAGALTVLHGLPLYDADVLPFEPVWAQLPFTYPPFAALVFAPLSPLPIQIGWGVLNALSVLSLVAVSYIVIRRLPRRPSWFTPGWGSLVVSLPLLAFEPVRVTLEYGQVNAVLMALVVLDVLVISGSAGRAGRFGGVLVGVAAAIKLTPLIFVVHLLLTGRKADAARAAGTFAGLQGLMLLIAPHDVTRFFTHTIFDSARIGPNVRSWNQSLSGMVRRFSDSASWSQPVAYLLGAALAVGAAVLVMRFSRRGRPVHALLVSAFLALLISPVSWIHHWVWLVPLVALLFAEAALGNRIAQWVLPAALALFGLPVLRWLTNVDEKDWNFAEFALGNSWVLFPVVVGVVLLVVHRRRVNA